MARAYFSKVLDVPVAHVWRIVRDFGAVAAWFPSLKHSEVLGGGPSEVGAVRVVTALDDSVVQEQLLELSDIHRRVVYTVVEGDVPMKNYRAVLTLHEIVADPARCFAEWSGQFDVDGDADPVIRFLLSFFESCLDELARVASN